MRPAITSAVHPLKCNCGPCTGPRLTIVPHHASQIVEAADVSALAWGAGSGAAVALLLMAIKFGPALIAWLSN